MVDVVLGYHQISQKAKTGIKEVMYKHRQFLNKLSSIKDCEAVQNIHFKHHDENYAEPDPSASIPKRTHNTKLLSTLNGYGNTSSFSCLGYLMEAPAKSTSGTTSGQQMHAAELISCLRKSEDIVRRAAAEELWLSCLREGKSHKYQSISTNRTSGNSILFVDID